MCRISITRHGSASRVISTTIISGPKATRDRKVVKATAFAIDRGDEKQRQFQNILRAIGFEVKLRPFIQRNDGSAKGDWDVGITLDVLEFAPLADVVVLASGDGDFDLLVRKIREKHHVSSRFTASPHSPPHR